MENQETRPNSKTSKLIFSSISDYNDDSVNQWELFSKFENVQECLCNNSRMLFSGIAPPKKRNKRDLSRIPQPFKRLDFYPTRTEEGPRLAHLKKSNSLEVKGNSSYPSLTKLVFSQSIPVNTDLLKFGEKISSSLME